MNVASWPFGEIHYIRNKIPFDGIAQCNKTRIDVLARTTIRLSAKLALRKLRANPLPLSLLAWNEAPLAGNEQRIDGSQGT
jgi:hypothetical protein